MKGGFIRGLFIGAVAGTVAGVMLGPEYRYKAKKLIHQGEELFKRGEDSIELVSSWVEKGQKVMEDISEPVNGQEEVYNTGKENINRRVAMLEKRLEDLEYKGV